MNTLKSICSFMVITVMSILVCFTVAFTVAFLSGMYDLFAPIALFGSIFLVVILGIDGK